MHQVTIGIIGLLLASIGIYVGVALAKDLWPFAERVVENCGYSGADLRGRDFSGQNLKGCDYSGADLKGADFSGANLQGTDFSGANLQGADLSGADLRGVSLFETNLAGADLVGANWREALCDPTQRRLCSENDLMKAGAYSDKTPPRQTPVTAPTPATPIPTESPTPTSIPTSTTSPPTPTPIVNPTPTPAPVPTATLAVGTKQPRPTLQSQTPAYPNGENRVSPLTREWLSYLTISVPTSFGGQIVVQVEGEIEFTPPLIDTNLGRPYGAEVAIGTTPNNPDRTIKIAYGDSLVFNFSQTYSVQASGRYTYYLLAHAIQPERYTIKPASIRTTYTP